MTGQKKSAVIPDVMLLSKICHICCFSVMFDSDLIKLNTVEQKGNEQVKKNFINLNKSA
jgi:hypothetical protein